MNAELRALLQERWGKLRFGRVARTIAREPEDILSIGFRPHVEYEKSDYTRIADVPRQKRRHMLVEWRRWYGFTEDSCHFDSNGFHRYFDTFEYCTFDFQDCLGCWSTYDRIRNDAWIVGVIEEPDKFLVRRPHYERWHPVPYGFKLIVEAVLGDGRIDTSKIVHDLEGQDEYWALARLIFDDDISWAPDDLRPYDQMPRHPLCHTDHQSWRGGWSTIVGRRGLNMVRCQDGSPISFLHNFAFFARHDEWWERFLTEAKKMGREYFMHPGKRNGHRAFCRACCGEGRSIEAEEIPYLAWRIQRTM